MKEGGCSVYVVLCMLFCLSCFGSTGVCHLSGFPLFCNDARNNDIDVLLELACLVNFAQGRGRGVKGGGNLLCV